MPRLPTLLFVTLGGVAGTLARWGVGQLLARPDALLPRATLLINLAGSGVLGFVLRHGALAAPGAEPVRLGLAVGFCGAFTTMSTFAVELLRLLQGRQHALAAGYAAATIAGCLAAAALGWAAAERLAVP